MEAPQTTRPDCCRPARQPFVLQIHPSLRCNLSCAHCYSRSGPTVRTALDTATVLRVIGEAAALGYEVVSFSGGEPLMYDGLGEACAFAHSLGLAVTVTTNGFFLDAKHLDPIAASVTGLAISLDGDAAAHNAMRGNRAAHDRLLGGLDAVRARGIPFGFIHTLTARSWPHLEALAAFAAQAGARLFQIHPLEAQGRAETMPAELRVDDIMLAKVYVLAHLLDAQYDGKPQISTDLAPTAELVANPELIYAAHDTAAAGDEGGPLLRSLVVEADGTVVPFTFGIAREYALGNITSAPLAHVVRRYAEGDGYARLRALCRQVHAALAMPGAPQLVNWYELLHRESRALLPDPA
jgi:Fe-coproporphyrin III synthase